MCAGWFFRVRRGLMEWVVILVGSLLWCVGVCWGDSVVVCAVFVFYYWDVCGGGPCVCSFVYVCSALSGGLLVVFLVGVEVRILPRWWVQC